MISILKNEDTADFLVFEAKDGDTVLGSIYCSLSEDKLVISKIDSEAFLVDGLCRTALNYALNRGFNICEFFIDDNELLLQLQTLGFVQNNNKIINDIDNFFTSHKNCKKS